MVNIDSNENELLFKRGYLIVDQEVSFFKDGWTNCQVGEFSVYFDELNDSYFYKNGNKWIFILGYMIDTVTKECELSKIGQCLLEKLERSTTEYFDYLDELSGRYIVLFNDGKKSKILSDATGMKSIVYSVDKTVISSHMSLAKEIAEVRESSRIKSEWKTQYKGYYVPGHFTPFENIYYLTPNTLLEIDSKKVVRFFPRERINIKDMDSIVEEVSTLVKNQMEVVTKWPRPLIFSLTAGSDSRTTLSLAKNYVNDINFFTYYKRSKKMPEGVKSLEVDREVVGEMTFNLNIPHTYIPLIEGDMNEEYKKFIEIMRVNTITPHSYRLAKFYLDNLPNEALHIRSNILEIARYFYRGSRELPKVIDPTSMAYCFSKLALEDQGIIEAFKEYYETVEMNNIYNYDGFDLFYWEFRMGIWHSKLMLESDIAHETFIPFNSRNILKLLLSVSDDNKKKNTVFKKIVEKNWPILNYWGINTTDKTVNTFDEQIDGYGMDLKDLKFLTNISSNSIKKWVYGNKSKFHIDKSNPSLGDYVEASYQYSTKPQQWYNLTLHVRSPYESQKHHGRLKYQIILNNKTMLEEDISASRETNQIRITFQAIEELTKLKVKVVATRDCESWNWGEAGTIIIERLIIRKGKEEGEKVTTSSPYSRLVDK